MTCGHADRRRHSPSTSGTIPWTFPLPQAPGPHGSVAILEPVAGQNLDRDALRSVPSWGLSFLLHALFLLLLALLIRVGRSSLDAKPFESQAVPPAIADLTSLVEASPGGRPVHQGTEPRPAIAGARTGRSSGQVLGPARDPGPGPVWPRTGRSRRSQRQRSDAALRRDGHRRARGGPRLPGLADDITAPFSGRSGLDPGPSGAARRGHRAFGEGGRGRAGLDGAAPAGRRRLVPEFPGAMPGQWLSAAPRHRIADGGNRSGPLALAGRRLHSQREMPASGLVRRGVEWLVQHQQPTGDLFVGGPGIAYMYSHAIATMALCEAYGISRDPRLKEPARRCVNFIIEAQNTQGGGWRYSPGQAGDTSVFGWQIFALRSGHLAGLLVPRTTLRGCTDYLNMAATDAKKILYAYQPGRAVTPVMTAEALVGRQLLGWSAKQPFPRQGCRPDRRQPRNK